MAILKPSPGAPIMAEAGTVTRSNFSRASGCGAMTSMRSATERPGISRAAERPRGPWRRGLRRCARTRRRDRRCRRWKSRSFRRRAHSRRRSACAVSAILATSEPDCGSVSAKAAIAPPPRVRLSQSRCLALPNRLIGAGAEALHGEGEIGQAVVARQRLADEAERAHVERRRRVGIGRSVCEPAVAAELLHQVAAGGVDVAVIGRQVRRAPVLEASGQRAMAVGRRTAR